MLGTKCWDKWPKPCILNTGNEGWDAKVREMRGMTINSNYCPSSVLPMRTWGLFIVVVTGGNYNIRNAIHLP
jgi:hypothetical protein